MIGPSEHLYLTNGDRITGLFECRANLRKTIREEREDARNIAKTAQYQVLMPLRKKVELRLRGPCGAHTVSAWLLHYASRSAASRSCTVANVVIYQNARNTVPTHADWSAILGSPCFCLASSASCARFTRLQPTSDRWKTVRSGPLRSSGMSRKTWPA